MMHLGDGHASVHVLLVRQDDQYRAGQLLLPQHIQQLVLGNAYTVPVRRVHHVDDGVCVAVVATPVWSGMDLEIVNRLFIFYALALKLVFVFLKTNIWKFLLYY